MKRIIIFICFFIASCATTQNYREKLKEWLGSYITGVIAGWGEPSNEYMISNKNKIYTWLWVGKTLIPKKDYESSLKKLALESSNINWCKTSFVCDENGKIINFTFEGTWCKTKRAK